MGNTNAGYQIVGRVARFANEPKYPYKAINWAAVTGHLAASIIFTVLYSDGRPNLEIGYTESFLQWVRIENQTYNNVILKNKSSCAALEPEGRPLSTAENGDFCIVPTTESVGYGLDLGWLIIAFHFLSFFFQALAGVTDCCKNGCCGYKYSAMIESGRNPLRFVEYSISASIMLICIAFVNGVTDVNLIAAIAVLTACCQLCGLVVEYMEVGSRLKWVLHLTGWIQFLCAYGIITHAFFKSVFAVDGVEPPSFVYAIVFALFALYASFGGVQLTELFC